MIQSMSCNANAMVAGHALENNFSYSIYNIYYIDIKSWRQGLNPGGGGSEVYARVKSMGRYP